MSKVHIITSINGTPELEEKINVFLHEHTTPYDSWIVRSVIITPGGYVAALLQTEDK